MKGKYIIFIALLVLVFLAFQGAIFLLPLGNHPQLQNSIQGTGIFVALFAAIIALSTADRKKKHVNIRIEPFINPQSLTYHKNEMTDYLRNLYKGRPDTFKSHQVNFKMTNLSGFTLENTTLTFVLPYEKQPPYKKEGQTMYDSRGFTTNILNPPQMLFEEKMILSTPFLPFWNHQDSMTVWIRMLLEDAELEPFMINISVNSEKAEGKTYPVKIPHL